MSVRIYLRQPLFTLARAPHLPKSTLILEGKLGEGAAGGVDIDVTGYFDHEGKSLDGAPCRLFLPTAKIDHIQYLQASTSGIA